MFCPAKSRTQTLEGIMLTSGWIKRHVVLGAVMISLLSPAMASAEKKEFRIGSANLGSTGYIQWESASFVVNKHAPALNVSALSTAGTTENAILLDKGKIELANLTSLEVFAASEGQSPFRKKMDIWQVFSWTSWSQPVVVPADSDLKTYRDLAGRNVSVIKKGSGANSMYRLILEEYGIYKDVKKHYLSWNDSVDAMLDGIIDATVASYPGGKPVPVFLNLAAREPYRVLELDLDVMKRVNARNKGIVVTTLPRSAYEGLSADIPSPGFTGIVGSTRNVDDETIYQFCKALFENVDELHEISDISHQTTLENATRWLLPDYPVHPGAARYFKEKGVWRDDLKVAQR